MKSVISVCTYSIHIFDPTGITSDHLSGPISGGCVALYSTVEKISHFREKITSTLILLVIDQSQNDVRVPNNPMSSSEDMCS